MTIAIELERYRVTTVALNVRSGPSNTSKIVGHVIKDQVIDKIAETPDGGWIKHKENLIEGWSSKKYLLKIADNGSNGDFPWLAIADKEYGVIEIPGKEHNPRVPRLEVTG